MTHLIASIDNSQYRNYVECALNTGMRPSELIALNWDNVDFFNGRLSVDSAVVLGEEKKPKTNAGFRSIELNEKVLVALKSQKAFTFLAGGRVFSNPVTQKPWTDSTITANHWRKTIKLAGLRYRNQYQTRHTFATMHISRGANLFWLSSQMGHSSPEMLFKHYGRYLKEYDGHTQRNTKAV